MFLLYVQNVQTLELVLVVKNVHHVLLQKDVLNQLLNVKSSYYNAAGGAFGGDGGAGDALAGVGDGTGGQGGSSNSAGGRSAPQPRLNSFSQF